MAVEDKYADEKLSDEELEQVAGGYYQTWGDYLNFQKLGGGFYKGVCGYTDKFNMAAVMNAFESVGEYLGLEISATCFYDSKEGENPNRYYLDGKQISRDELWDIINKAYAAKKK